MVAPTGHVVVRMLDAGPARVRRWQAALGSVPVIGPHDPAPPHDVLVSVDDGVRRPGWPWLPALLSALETSGADAVQPPLVGPDHTVVAPFLTGHPVSSLDHLAGTTLPSRFPGVEARRAGRNSPGVLTTATWLPTVSEGTQWPAELPPAEGLHWSIQIAAPAAPIGRRWGDWHFACSLAQALRRLGQRVEIDHPETAHRPGRGDVVLVLRGLHRVEPQPGMLNLLWVISHPHDVRPDELGSFDHVWAASTAWAAAHDVEAMVQCTDTTRFHPLEVAQGSDVVFVGNARGGPRPVVLAAREAGVPVRVTGAGWSEYGIEAEATAIPNHDLPAAYARAGVVLNDHHADMREQGFISNRVFDVLAVGGRLLSDDVPGLADLFPDLPTWHTAADLARLTQPPFPAFPDDVRRRAVAEHVVAHHSFDARAARLLEVARAVGSPT